MDGGSGQLVQGVWQENGILTKVEGGGEGVLFLSEERDLARPGSYCRGLRYECKKGGMYSRES